MDFEELQKSWKTQEVKVPELRPELINQLQSSQRKLKRNTLIGTILFALVYVDLIWVYISFNKGRTIFFGGSILMMGIVMMVYLWVLWKGINYDKYDPTTASNEYIDKYLQKLRWQRKTITQYVWVYAILLWLAFMFYCYDVTMNGSTLLKILAPTIITVYVFGMLLLARFTKKKKQLKKINELINEMEELKGKMEE